MRKKNAYLIIVALLSFIVFLSTNIQVDLDSRPINITVTEHAHALTACPTCPSPSELKMVVFDCSDGGFGTKCWFDGNGCDVSAQ